MGLRIGTNFLTEVKYSGHAEQPATCTMNFSTITSPVERIDLKPAKEMKSGDGDEDMWRLHKFENGILLYCGFLFASPILWFYSVVTKIKNIWMVHPHHHRARILIHSRHSYLNHCTHDCIWHCGRLEIRCASMNCERFWPRWLYHDVRHYKSSQLVWLILLNTA